LRLRWSFEFQRECVQARFKFFTKQVVNQALTRDARKSGERGRHHKQPVMGFPARTRAGMAGVQARFIYKCYTCRCELRAERGPHAFSARKMRFVACQFLVRLTSDAHTYRSYDGRVCLSPEIR
jgi:hypothetical protein